MEFLTDLLYLVIVFVGGLFLYKGKLDAGEFTAFILYITNVWTPTLTGIALLFGIGNPSGKLSDTFAKRLEDYPSSYHFHESKDYVDYTEDIYVGYRYFETLPGAAEKVNYPFGYGLSYTTFDISYIAAESEMGKVTVKAAVTNTGSVAGREVVQLYASVPIGDGAEKQRLVAFAKTKEFDYRSSAKTLYDKMKKELEEDGLAESMSAELTALERALEIDKEKFLRLKKDEIIPFIEEELAVIYWYQKAGIQVRLRYDKQLKDALVSKTTL